MFAKLFSRITESSLMEEPLEVRYCFMMLLAMCDPTGHVIGTDVAIARRMNMPLIEFQRSMEALFQPDPDSNSREEDGRRIIPSEHERGYKVVNYLTYRDMKSEENKREYMKAYMRDYREKKRSRKTVKANSKTGKEKVTVLDHAEEEVEGDQGNGAKAPVAVEESVFDRFQKVWNSLPSPFPKIRNMSPDRRSELNARLRDRFWKDNFKEAMEIMRNTDFAKGKNERGWVMDVDFFLRPGSVAKILEGKYEDRDIESSEEPRGEFAKPFNPPPQAPDHILARRAAEAAAKQNGTHP